MLAPSARLAFQSPTNVAASTGLAGAAAGAAGTSGSGRGSWSRRGGRRQHAEQLGRQPILGIELDHPLELSRRGVGVAANRVMIGQQELGRRRIDVGEHMLLQGAELLRVNVDVGIQAHQCGPIPTGPGRQTA